MCESCKFRNTDYCDDCIPYDPHCSLYERWAAGHPELARLEQLEELGSFRDLTPKEEAELEALYRWRDSL